MKKYFLICILFVGCDFKENTSVEIENVILKDIFINLLDEDYSYKSFEKFKLDYYLKNIDTITIDSLNKIYLEEEVNKKDTILFSKIPFSINKKEEKMIFSIGLENLNTELIMNNNSIIYDIEQIKNRNGYHIVNKENREVSKQNIIYINLSKIYFNENKDKAAFILQKKCGAMCFKRKVIFVIKAENSWEIKETMLLEIS